MPPFQGLRSGERCIYPRLKPGVIHIQPLAGLPCPAGASGECNLIADWKFPSIELLLAERDCFSRLRELGIVTLRRDGKPGKGANLCRRAEQPKAQVVFSGALFWFIFWAIKK
jgi:hypothetical protein